MGNHKRKQSADWREEWTQWEREEPGPESDDYRSWSGVGELRRALDGPTGPAVYLPPAAEAYFGPVVAAAPPRYRESLARLAAAYVRDAMEFPAFRETVAQAEDPERFPPGGFEGAWVRLPGGDLCTVGNLLNRVRTDGLFFTALMEIEYLPEKPHESDWRSLSLLDRLVPAGLPALVRDAAADPDPMIRVMAASVCYERSSGPVSLNERLSALAPSVLPPLLADPAPEVRAEAALRLANYLRYRRLEGPEAAALVPAVTAVLTEAAAAGMGYMVPRGRESDGNLAGVWRRRAAFMTALADDLGAGPDCFGALGADALPELVDCLRHVANREDLARAAAVALARLGVATVETLYLLGALREGRWFDQETRKTAGAAFDALAERLAAGTASVPGTGEGLLLAVWRNPDDRTARLIYADWLDEHDQPERAEYVRLCTAAPPDDSADGIRRRELAQSFTADTVVPDRPGWFALWRWATAPASPF